VAISQEKQVLSAGTFLAFEVASSGSGFALLWI
jgi:hypothetical protein